MAQIWLSAGRLASELSKEAKPGMYLRGEGSLNRKGSPIARALKVAPGKGFQKN
jgi:hypothetical protein